MIRKLITILTIVVLPLVANAKMVLTIDGPEDSYNQIRLVNETSKENFKCRVIVLNEDESQKFVYGVYRLKEYRDSDSNTQSISKGTKIGIELPSDFDAELNYEIEYLDLPLFDIVVIHLTDKEDNSWK